VVSIDDVYQKKLDMLDAHVSQFYEWLPWHDDQLKNVPNDPAARKQWIMTFEPSAVQKVPTSWRPSLEKRYGPAASKIRYVEGFEITEYGYQPSEQEIRRLFPFFPAMTRDH